jgi:hypothetical protein
MTPAARFPRWGGTDATANGSSSPLPWVKNTRDWRPACFQSCFFAGHREFFAPYTQKRDHSAVVWQGVGRIKSGPRCSPVEGEGCRHGGRLVRLKERAHCYAQAWAAYDRVQIEIARVRLTATPDEAMQFARQLMAAAERLRTPGEAPGE